MGEALILNAGVAQNQNVGVAHFSSVASTQDKVQEQIDREEEKIQRLKAEKADLDRQLATVKQQRLNEEGIRQFCRLAAKNLDTLTKDQWQMLNNLLKLRVTVYNKTLMTVRIALPPVKRATEIELSRLSGSFSWGTALKALPK